MNGVGIFLMVVAVCFCLSLVVIAGVLWRILVEHLSGAESFSA